MSPFSLLSLAVCLLCACLSLFTLFQIKSRVHFFWALFNICVSLWGWGLYKIGQSPSPYAALYYWKWVIAINTFLPAILYDLVVDFCSLKHPSWTSPLIHGISFLFASVSIFTNIFTHDFILVFNSLYFPKANIFLTSWLLFLALVTLLSISNVFVFQRSLPKNSKQDATYLFWGMFIGFGGGFTLAFPSYNIHFYPIGQFFVCLYALIFTFGMLRHRFLDIQLSLIRFLIPFIFIIIGFFIYCATHFSMTLFTWTSLSLAAACFLLSFMIFAYAQSRVHKIWALFNLDVALWGTGIFLAGVSQDPNTARLCWKLAHIGVLFIPVLFFHTVFSFFNLTNKIILKLIYAQALIFVALLLFTSLIINPVKYIFNSLYYYVATPAYYSMFFIWLFVVLLAFFELFKGLVASKGLKKLQGAYLFWGSLIGFLGGASTVAPAFSLNIYPSWHFTIILYALTTTYAIFRYRLMDIHLAITRLGIFILVYSLVLGIPFGLIFLKKGILLHYWGDNWFWIPMITLLILATAGPFIYFFLQSKAENTLLQYDKRIQEMLKIAFAGITRIRDQKKLLRIMARLLRKILRVRAFAFYIQNPYKNQYVLKLFKDNRAVPESFAYSSPIVQSLIKKKSPLVVDELQYLLENETSKDQKLIDTLQDMKSLDASIVIPTISADNLAGFIVLGRREGQNIFSSDLINVLSMIGGQIALTLENTIFIETRERGLNEEFERRRLESLGTLCNSISHQMNNRFHAIMQRSSVPLEIYSEGKYKDLSRDELIGLVETFGKTTERILAISADGGKITETIQNFSKSNTEFSVVNFGDSLSKSLDLVSLKYPKFDFQIKREFSENVMIWGIEAPIQDILFNALDNSCYAMKSKLHADPNFIPKIIVRGNETKSFFVFEIEDNGSGINKENLVKVLDPMFTTKSHKDGTGMGTTVMQQFIQNHGGQIRYESEFGLWTKVIISLPLATDEQKRLTKNVK